MNSLGLSEKEREVIRLSAKGLADKEVADRLGVSFTTVRTYWKRIRGKLGTANKVAAVALVLTSECKERIAEIQAKLEPPNIPPSSGEELTG